MLYFVLIVQVIVIIVGVGVHLARNKNGHAGEEDLFEAFVAWFFFAAVGLGGVWAFMGHAFEADEVAKQIGWPSGNPFQFEVAVANLSYGVLGLLCLHYRGLFRWATAVVYSVFLWGAAYGHIYEIAVNNNHEPGNAGFVLYADIITPLLLLGMLKALHLRERPKLAEGVPV
jgi:hypothetical protein